MENRILYINASVRADSRTEELARCLLDALGSDVTEVKLYEENMLPLNSAGIKKRELHNYSDKEFNYARQFSEADVIVVAAPFWDLSFPSVLKIYFENITVSGITFEYSEQGHPVSRCKAKKLYYVTTAGGFIGNNNFGFDYIKALAEKFFGINDVFFLSAEGLDISDADVRKIMDEAKERISNLL